MVNSPLGVAFFTPNLILLSSGNLISSENVETPATLKSLARLKLPVPVNLACSIPVPPTTPLNNKLPAVVVLPKSFHEILVFVTLVLK